MARGESPEITDYKKMNILLLFLAIALHVLAPSIAHAGYDARASELRDSIKSKDLRDEKEREILSNALEDYIRARQECLDDLVRIVANTDSSLGLEAAWLARLDRCREAAGKLADAVKNIPDSPSMGALNFSSITQIEEINFYTNLTQTRIGERRNRITRNRDNVRDKTTALESKWQYLSGVDDNIDNDQRRVAQQLMDAINSAFDVADRERRTIKERLVASVQVVANVTKKTGKPIKEILERVPGEEAQALKAAIEAIEDAGEAVDVFAEQYLKTNALYLARHAEFTALLASERGGVYVLFGEFRRDTEEFLKTHGYDAAKIDYQIASDALTRWASSTSTSGQRSDAEAFKKDLMSKLSDHLSDTERTFNDFVSKHHGRFFGPVGPSVVESLAEVRVWEDWNKVMEGKGLETKLRVWRNEANNFFDVSLAGLNTADQSYLKDLLLARITELIRALDEAALIGAKYKRDFDRKQLPGELTK